MTRYELKSFSVPISNGESRKDCTHGWIRDNGRCWYCDQPMDEQAIARQQEINLRGYIIRGTA